MNGFFSLIIDHLREGSYIQCCFYVSCKPCVSMGELKPSFQKFVFFSFLHNGEVGDSENSGRLELIKMLISNPMCLPYKSNRICILKGCIQYNSQEVKLINIKHVPIVAAYKKEKDKKETPLAQTHEIRCYGINNHFPNRPLKANFILAFILNVCNNSPAFVNILASILTLKFPSL